MRPISEELRAVAKPRVFIHRAPVGDNRLDSLLVDEGGAPFASAEGHHRAGRRLGHHALTPEDTMPPVFRQARVTCSSAWTPMRCIAALSPEFVTRAVPSRIAQPDARSQVASS